MSRFVIFLGVFCLLGVVNATWNLAVWAIPAPAGMMLQNIPLWCVVVVKVGEWVNERVAP